MTLLRAFQQPLPTLRLMLRMRAAGKVADVSQALVFENVDQPDPRGVEAFHRHSFNQLVKAKAGMGLRHSGIALRQAHLRDHTLALARGDFAEGSVVSFLAFPVEPGESFAPLPLQGRFKLRRGEDYEVDVIRHARFLCARLLVGRDDHFGQDLDRLELGGLEELRGVRLRRLFGWRTVMHPRHAYEVVGFWRRQGDRGGRQPFCEELPACSRGGEKAEVFERGSSLDQLLVHKGSPVDGGPARRLPPSIRSSRETFQRNVSTYTGSRVRPCPFPTSPDCAECSREFYRGIPGCE